VQRHFDEYTAALQTRKEYLSFLRQCRDKINVTVNIDDKELPSTAFDIEKFVRVHDPEMEQHVIAFRAKYSAFIRTFIRINPHL
jgi:hypothetical protein